MMHLLLFLQGHPQIAKQMMEHFPCKPAKEIRDNRREPSYKALVEQYQLTEGQSTNLEALESIYSSFDSEVEIRPVSTRRCVRNRGRGSIRSRPRYQTTRPLVPENRSDPSRTKRPDRNRSGAGPLMSAWRWAFSQTRKSGQPRTSGVQKYCRLVKVRLLIQRKKAVILLVSYIGYFIGQCHSVYLFIFYPYKYSSGMLY